MSGMLTIQSDEQSPVEAKYQQEKADGTRLPNGVLPLKQLKPVHMEIIADYLSGMRNRDLAQKYGFTESRISILINHQPLAKDLIQAAVNDSRSRFNSLKTRAVEILAEGMQDGVDKGMQLRTLDRYHKMHDILGDKHTNQTAEDVIAQIMDRFLQSDREVTIGIKAEAKQ